MCIHNSTNVRHIYGKTPFRVARRSILESFTKGVTTVYLQEYVYLWTVDRTLIVMAQEHQHTILVPNVNVLRVMYLGGIALYVHILM